MNPGGASGEGAAGILKAVGSLLMALSGADQGQMERTLNEMQSPQSVPDGGQTPASEAEPQRRPAVSRGIPGYPRPQAHPAGTSPRAETTRGGVRPQQDQPGELLDEVEFVLADARERAQRIIDQSMDHARDLIQQERAAAAPVAGIDPRAFDDLRRGLRGLVTEVRDIQQRLGRIEQLLRDQNERAATSPVSAPTSRFAAPAPMRAEPEHAEPRRADIDLSIEEPAPAWRAPEPPPAEEPLLEDAPWTDDPDPGADPEANISEFEAAADLSRFNAPRYTSPSDLSPEHEIEEERREDPPAAASSGNPAPAPPRSTFSVVPPQRREWASETEPDEADEAYETDDAEEPPRPAAPRSAAPEAAVEEPEHETAFGSPLATFLPSDGAITLRVTPVAGFQGLMRVQDALTKMPAVRHASVEAYSQGEARLRLELADTADSDELAEGLSRALHGSARVEDASEVNRELLITLR